VHDIFGSEIFFFSKEEFHDSQHNPSSASTLRYRNNPANFQFV
jgi:hypothetical protein